MSTWYRRNACLRKGHKEYTHGGFEQAKKNFIAADLDVDCCDKHYLITGSNRGIGLETALEIARKGGVVHLLCRNRSSMLEARSHIITTTGNDRLHLHTLDLSRPRDVGRWAQDFTSTHDQLDVLVHNAGTMQYERTVDDDGIETTFAVNTLSVHLLTIILLPLLQRSPEPRVITVSSSDLLQVKLDSEDINFEKMEPFDGYQAYAQTKRQQAVMNVCYAQRYERVRFYSMHPGWVDTKLLKRSQSEFYSLTQQSLRTAKQGADTVVWLAISQAALKHASGLFFQDRRPISYHLPLAWTRHTLMEEKSFMQKLDRQLAAVSAYPLSLEESSESGFDEPTSNDCVTQSWKSTPSSIDSQSIDSHDEKSVSCANQANGLVSAADKKCDNVSATSNRTGDGTSQTVIPDEHYVVEYIHNDATDSLPVVENVQNNHSSNEQFTVTELVHNSLENRQYTATPMKNGDVRSDQSIVRYIENSDSSEDTVTIQCTVTELETSPIMYKELTELSLREEPIGSDADDR